MRKILSLVLAVALLLSVSAFTFASADEEPYTITVIQKYGSDERNALLKELLEDAGYDYQLEFIDTTASDLNERIMMISSSGQKLDILFDVNVLESNLIDGGYELPLTEFCESWEDYANIDQALMNLSKAWNGEPYAIPIEKYERILFYRSDWLEEAGYDHAPTTMQELYEMSQYIQENFEGRYGYSFRGGQGVASMFEMEYLGHYSTDLIDLTHPFITTEGYVLTDERYKDNFTAALQAYKWQYENLAPADSITWGYPEMVEAFYSGVTCFLVQTAEVIETCSQYMEEGTWNTAILPVTDNGCAYNNVSCGSMAVSSTTQNPQACYDFIKAVCGYEGAKKYAAFYGTTPMYAYEDFGSSYYDAYAEIVNNPDTQVAFSAIYSQMTEDEIAFQQDYGFNEDLLLEQYLAGEITEDDVIAEYNAYWAWVEDSEWVAEIRAAAEK